MTTCKICENEYATWRDHCPTCGSGHIDGFYYNMIGNNDSDNKLTAIVAARGAEPVKRKGVSLYRFHRGDVIVNQP